MNVNASSSQFFATHPVFTGEEFRAQRSTGRRSAEALLLHHLKAGRVLRIRRGLYASVPPGSSVQTFEVDPFLVAGKASDDAVLAYHTALQFHGRAHSVHQTFLYLTNRASRRFSFRGSLFQSASLPSSLKTKRAEEFGVMSQPRGGLMVRVTTLERTLVDVLDRPELAGGWEEIWRSLESVEFFDLDQVLGYVALLDNATTAAKVGFYLEQHKNELMVQEHHLTQLESRRPQKPHYFSRSQRHGGRLLSRWNLVVPAEVIERRWQEVA